MTAQERFKLVIVKVERAKEHFQLLKNEERDYINSEPYTVVCKSDIKTRCLIYFVESICPTPLKLSAVLGDTINNLRSSLDHLAYQLVWVGTGKIPANHVYFPISGNSGDYLKQRKCQLKGATKKAIDAIDALKPYKGGNDTLWRLHKLNNIDKHRVLITAGSAFRSVDLGPHILREIQKQVPLLL